MPLESVVYCQVKHVVSSTPLSRLAFSNIKAKGIDPALVTKQGVAKQALALKTLSDRIASVGKKITKVKAAVKSNADTPTEMIGAVRSSNKRRRTDQVNVRPASCSALSKFILNELLQDSSSPDAKTWSISDGVKQSLGRVMEAYIVDVTRQSAEFSRGGMLTKDSIISCHRVRADRHPKMAYDLVQNSGRADAALTQLILEFGVV